MALEDFVEHAWETQLLHLTIEDLKIDSVSDIDLRAKCQLCFYLASSFLTRGRRAAARSLFEASASALTQGNVPKQYWQVARSVDPRRERSRSIVCSRSASIQLRALHPWRTQGTALPTSCATRPWLLRFWKTCLAYRKRPMSSRNCSGSRLDWAAGFMKECLTRRRGISTIAFLAPPSPQVKRPPFGHAYGRRTPISSCASCAQAGSTRPIFRTNAGGHIVRISAVSWTTPAHGQRWGPIHKLWRDTAKDGREVSPFCRRRFSGDSSVALPRTRYHALCDPNNGDDGGTVVAEMMAYTLPTLTGYCAARQGAHEIEVVFRGFPHEPNPFHSACRAPDGFEHLFGGLPSGNPLRELTALPSADNVLIMSMATRITQQQFERCLDLRMPDAREWLTRFFANPPDGVHGNSLRVLANVHHFDLRTVSSWSNVLPVLIARTSGGNTLTDMVGAYLRSLGCDALIFPSARNDFVAAFSEDTLVSASGWNLVDYRGLGPVDQVGLDIGDPIEPLEGQIELLESDEADTAGSIRLLGNRLTTRVINQINYEYFLFAHGPRWCVEHKEFEMFARSYLWYRKRYPQGDGGFLGICDQCEHSFTDESVAILSRCPLCGFQGD